ncbi:MAG: polysaccharide deacetylase family protein [Nitrososphaerota archaeon]|nr:polysaccharide deacetylase family protein [Nitrososphaerota archaeon]
MSPLKIGLDPPKASLSYPGEARAACVISLDFDHFTRSQGFSDKKWLPEVKPGQLEKNRAGTRDMLSVSEKYGIPMTWAICGRTAEEDYPSYNRILESKQLQEIGVHTYSHADVSACTEEELHAEVDKCLEILKLKERPKTFIFPWNRMGHFEDLSKLGFIAYRDQKRSIGNPKENCGLVNIAPTYYVDEKSYGAEWLMRKYLDVCISWNSMFHLWMHPWSVVFENDASGKFVKRTIDPLFSYIQKKRDEGILAVCTLGDLASFIKKNDQTT